MSIWSRVDALVDGSTNFAGLQAHGVDLYAARRWRTIGRSIPEDFRNHERAAAMANLAVPAQLAQIRDVLDGEILVMKGPEVASYYPEPSLRPYRDLDILVHNAENAHSSLVRAGWEAVSQARAHHPPELLLPGTSVSVEIHGTPNWPWWTSADTRELFEHAVPSTLDVAGIQTLCPAHHAVLLAAHSWQHEPIRRLVDVIDVALLAQDLDGDMLEHLAGRWGLKRVWKTTTSAIHALLLEEQSLSPARRLLIRHCQELRQRTDLESRLAYLAAGLWAPTPSTIVLATAARAILSIRPALPESWDNTVSGTHIERHHSISPSSKYPSV